MYVEIFQLGESVFRIKWPCKDLSRNLSQISIIIIPLSQRCVLFSCLRTSGILTPIIYWYHEDLLSIDLPPLYLSCPFFVISLNIISLSCLTLWLHHFCYHAWLGQWHSLAQLLKLSKVLGSQLSLSCQEVPSTKENRLTQDYTSSPVSPHSQWLVMYGYETPLFFLPHSKTSLKGHLNSGVPMGSAKDSALLNCIAFQIFPLPDLTALPAMQVYSPDDCPVKHLDINLHLGICLARKRT